MQTDGLVWCSLSLLILLFLLTDLDYRALGAVRRVAAVYFGVGYRGVATPTILGH